MRCNICNSVLSPAEIKMNADTDKWEPCGKCLEVIRGVFNDDDEDQITTMLQYEFGFNDDEPDQEPEEPDSTGDT